MYIYPLKIKNIVLYCIVFGRLQRCILAVYFHSVALANNNFPPAIILYPSP